MNTDRQEGDEPKGDTAKTPVTSSIKEPTILHIDAPSHIPTDKEDLNDTEGEPSRVPTSTPHTFKYYIMTQPSFESQIELPRRSSRRNTKRVLLTYPDETGQLETYVQAKNDNYTRSPSNSSIRTDIRGKPFTTPMAMQTISCTCQTRRPTSHWSSTSKYIQT